MWPSCSLTDYLPIKMASQVEIYPIDGHLIYISWGGKKTPILYLVLEHYMRKSRQNPKIALNLGKILLNFCTSRCLRTVIAPVMALCALLPQALAQGFLGHHHKQHAFHGPLDPILLYCILRVI